MMNTVLNDQAGYAQSMGRLLVLYTQIDQFIMQACAERLPDAPDDQAKMGLGKQVGDECHHVRIQRQWMDAFNVDPAPVINEEALERLHAHFRSLDWVDFLTDLYLCIEALGSQAVEQIVPLADPGTRESLRIPLQDEMDHVAFGVSELRKALLAMDEAQRAARLRHIPERIRYLVKLLNEWNLPVAAWFEGVGANFDHLCKLLAQRKDELLLDLAA